jgi:hypothetical protein
MNSIKLIPLDFDHYIDKEDWKQKSNSEDYQKFMQKYQSSTDCPVARALKRIYPNSGIITVSSDEAIIFKKDSTSILATIKIIYRIEDIYHANLALINNAPFGEIKVLEVIDY